MRLLPSVPMGLVGLIFCLAPTPSYGQSDDAQAQFKTLVQNARQARDAGDYAKAIELLESAYAVSPKPVLLNNIGKACEELGWYDKAVDAYKRVANDPKADPAIRTLDEARIGKLSPLLDRGWISLPPAAAKRGAWVNGAPYRAGVRGDFGVPPGPAAIETIADDGKTLLLLSIQVPAGRRHTVESTAVPSNLSRVGVPSGSNRPAGITVDGYQLRGYSPGIERLALSPGPHRFLLTGAQTNGTARVSAQLAPGAMDATLLAEAEYSGAKSDLPVGPLVGLTLGVSAIGFGGWQISTVQGDRDDLAANVRLGLSNGLPERAVQRRLDEENDALASDHAVGVAILATGVAVVGGSLWWWFSKPSSATTDAPETGAVWVAPTGTGIALGGAF